MERREKSKRAFEEFLKESEIWREAIRVSNKICDQYGMCCEERVRVIGLVFDEMKKSRGGRENGESAMPSE